MKQEYKNMEEKNRQSVHTKQKVGKSQHQPMYSKRRRNSKLKQKLCAGRALKKFGRSCCNNETKDPYFYRKKSMLYLT